MPDCDNDWIHNDVGDVPAVLEGFLTNLCAGAVRNIVKDGKSLWSAIPGFDHTYITLLARCWELSLSLSNAPYQLLPTGPQPTLSPH